MIFSFFRQASRILLFIRFLFFYLKILIISNLRVAYDVITPTHHMRPGILCVPITLKSDLQILLLTNLISMTPGTLSLDVATDRSALYLHVMYFNDYETLAAEVHNLENRIKGVLP